MSKNDFIKICSDQKFWQWINKKSEVPYQKVENKKNFLSDIYQKIALRTYYPQPPKEYLILNKGNGVVRVIPALQLDDLCVYYYCVRKLEKYIAINHSPGTYGGFALSGQLRKAEEEELKKIKDKYEVVEIDGMSFIFSSDYTISGINPYAWQAEWGDFNQKLYFNCRDKNFKYATELDVANFYDSIQLDNLEYKLRGKINNNLNEVIYLLMHFLRFWNRHINFYRQQGAGIPQDTFGECSRLLANFYLQEYDKQISDFCKKNNSRYFRYADDQIIFSPSKEMATKIVSKASSLLMREGLNFNQKKVNLMSMDSFEIYFSFDNFLALKPSKFKKISKIELNKQINFYLRNKELLRKKGFSLLKRILKITKDMKKKPLSFSKLKKYILSEDFLLNSPLGADDLEIIYLNLLYDEKKKFVKLLNKEAETCLYTVKLFSLRRFFIKFKIPVSNIRSAILRSKKFYNLIKK